jgi:transposase
MMLLASAGGNRVPVIARLIQADEDTVREVIHRFNEIGLACLDPRWAGGRPRLLTPDDEDFVVQTATTRPTKLGRPFTRWSIRKLAAYLRRVHGCVIRIGREALRCLLLRRGVTFQRTKTWKESPHHPNHVVQTRALHRYLRWRNANARHPRPARRPAQGTRPHPQREGHPLGRASPRTSGLTTP